MVSCASCGCTMTQKSKNEGITFHSFPKDCRRRLWIEFLRKPDWLPKPSSVLCSHHFAQDCFDRMSKLKVRLQATAVPTVEVTRLKYVRSNYPTLYSTANENSSQSTSSCLLKTNLTLSSTANDVFSPPTSRSVLKKYVLLTPKKETNETTTLEASDGPISRNLLKKNLLLTPKIETSESTTIEASNASTSRSLLKKNLLLTPKKETNKTTTIDVSDG
ncbi:THAP domain-containing protein 2 [Diabrotica virgifera virgifera]|uniref:THAP-type domain-containing protein n=1 Tax=Diabrotica virgifera virgifera TaxID=50390 RepID=A0ABM5IE70_DIAVI|nr:THAP domain-containing protein 2 [Diabrotica virgifera virgifera]